MQLLQITSRKSHGFPTTEPEPPPRRSRIPLAAQRQREATAKGTTRSRMGRRSSLPHSCSPISIQRLPRCGQQRPSSAVQQPPPQPAKSPSATFSSKVESQTCPATQPPPPLVVPRHSERHMEAPLHPLGDRSDPWKQQDASKGQPGKECPASWAERTVLAQYSSG